MSETSVSDLKTLMVESIVSGVAKDMVHALVQEAIENGGEVSLASVKSRWEEKALARARLNEAAPTLLAALEDCVSVMERELGGLRVIQPELNQARAAIAKARGEV